MLGSKTLISDRLILRKINQSDVKEIYEGFVNQKEFLYWANKKPRTLQQQIDSLKGIDKKYLRNDYFNWIITLKGNGKIIGSINACEYEIQDSVLINYAIDNRYINNGYMSEALKIVLDYLLNEVKISNVYCGCCIENIASKKVMEKYMQYVSTIKNHVTLVDGLHDMYLFKLSK